jgi:hypothetical protein
VFCAKSIVFCGIQWSSVMFCGKKTHRHKPHRWCNALRAHTHYPDSESIRNSSDSLMWHAYGRSSLYTFQNILLWPDRGSKSRSTSFEVSTQSIAPPMRFMPVRLFTTEHHRTEWTSSSSKSNATFWNHQHIIANPIWKTVLLIQDNQHHYRYRNVFKWLIFLY